MHGSGPPTEPGLADAAQDIVHAALRARLAGLCSRAPRARPPTMGAERSDLLHTHTSFFWFRSGRRACGRRRPGSGGGRLRASVVRRVCMPQWPSSIVEMGPGGLRGGNMRGTGAGVGAAGRGERRAEVNRTWLESD